MNIKVPGNSTKRLFSQQSFAPFYLYATRDGSRVSYLGSEQNTGRQLMGSVELQSGKRISHGSGQPFYVAWSPDSSKLLFFVPLIVRGRR